ncbi:armadillo-type protein [Glomus cerebriforme]|uniref:Armadillo-type protein n=1 Tax=Glomus cerebriforme TaxID=658196 RepID=A0A397S7J4_9GLOM|nr:armadillo-type protein [Glomus cerebriforme]
MEAEAETIAKNERRQELRNANLLAWRQGKPDSSAFKNLDSNMKKNTGFIKKCKAQLSAEYQQQLLKDIKTLTLEKYISEVVVAVVEGLQKCKAAADVWATVEVISALHQRFPDTFTPFLTHMLARSLAPQNKQQLAVLSQEQREKEESTRIVKQRILLRIAGELWLIGVLRNVEDGIAAPNSGSAAVGAGSVNGVKDNVAGFVSGSIKELKETKETKTSGEGFMYTVLKDLLSHDNKHVNLPLAVSFIKYFGAEMLGTVGRKNHRDETAITSNENGEEILPVVNGDRETSAHGGKNKKNAGEKPIVNESQRSLFKSLLVGYFNGVEKHLIEDHQKIKALDRSNHEYYITRGEIPEETRQNYEKVVKAFEKFLQNAQFLADSLDLEMPILPEDDGTTKIGGTIIRDGSFTNEKEDNFTSSIWEDEDARSFYENLIDLKTLVPGVLLEVKSSSKKDDADTEKDDSVNILDKEDEEKIDDNQSDDEKRANGDDDKTDMKIADGEQEVDKKNLTDKDIDIKEVVKDQPDVQTASSSTKMDVESTNKSGTLAQLDSLLSRLPNMINRDLIDQAAVDFCYLNSKASRKKLIKTLFGVPRTRLDLLPYYSRLIATLNPHYPDITEEVMHHLEVEFKSIQRKKTNDSLEIKIKNIRFISELTKFRITPQHIIFHCLKVLLDDFSNQNIDVACNLLETCGRFLFKSPETSVRMGNMLDIMMRKKSVQHLDNRQLLMVENAYYQCNPPDRTAIVKKDRSVMEQYIRKLIYSDLNKKTVEKILKLLRKLNWEDKEVYRVLEKCFSKVWKIKYSNIHLMAILASGLHRYHSDFGVALVDRVIEDIRIGLEQNIFKHNQRRIATVKYLGELYNYRMVDSPVIFDTLYSITTLGHEFGRPAPNRINHLDAPNDFFRIRLCCTLLDTCGMCFDRGSSLKRLDDFLVFFQMYILTKQILSMDIEFMIADLFEMLRPDMTIYKTYEEAAAEVDKMLMENHKALQDAQGASLSQEDGVEESEMSSSDDDDDEEGQDEEMDRERGDAERSEEEAETDEVNEEEGEDELIVHTNRQEKVPTEEDEEFEREFSRMMTESMESRKYERKPAMLDVAIPMYLKGADKASDFLDGSVAFTLLTKKGNKQHIKTMEVPSDSALAVNTRSKQEAEREEQQQLKKLVLNYEEREEQNQRIALEQSLINSGVKVTYQSGNRRGQRGRKMLHHHGGGGDEGEILIFC